MSKFKLGDTAIFVTEQKRKWEVLGKAKTGLFSGTLNLSSAIQFFLVTLDEAINYAETKVDETGPSKKSFVLQALSSLYDTIIGANLPYWAYPFSSTIKSIVIDTLLSKAIDFFVEKYNAGQWKVV